MLVHTDGRVVLSDFGVTATLERHEDAAGALHAYVPDRFYAGSRVLDGEQCQGLWCAIHRCICQRLG